MSTPPSHYAKKIWTTHERRSAQARAIREQGEYILPVRLDDTSIPGLPDTIGYIDLRETSVKDLVALTILKLGERERRNYLPPVLDVLHKRTQAKSATQKRIIDRWAYCFLDTLEKMTEEERKVIFYLFRTACPFDLPKNVHVELDMVRRCAGMSAAEVKKILAGISALHFYVKVKRGHKHEGQDHLGNSQMIELEWHVTSIVDGGNATFVAHEMIIGVTAGYCEFHGMEALQRLDFSQLSSATAKSHSHDLEEAPLPVRSRHTKQRTRDTAPSKSRSPG